MFFGIIYGMKLPVNFKKILWSYNFDDVDPLKMKKTIVSNSLNYGSINHLKWLLNFYGKDSFIEIVHSIKDTDLKPKTKKLFNKVFNKNA